jgi:putative flippase GtrA
VNLVKREKLFLLIKFLVTGGLNTLFGYCMFTLFTYLTNHPSLSLVLATIFGVLFNFKTYSRFVFQSKDNSRLFRFLGAYIFLTTLQIVLLKGLNYLGIKDPYLAGAILVLPMALLSFILLRKFVFHQPILFDKRDNGNDDAEVIE